MSATANGAPTDLQVLPLWMMKLLGLFIGPLRESLELAYQNDQPYLFDSSKFENAYQFTATPYEQGLQATLAAMKKQ